MKAIENGLTVRRIEDVKDLLALHLTRRMAKLPAALSPTHVFEREISSGEFGVSSSAEGKPETRNPKLETRIVGYASLNAVPVLTGWLHDDRVSEAEAQACFDAIEQEARELGIEYLVMPCTDDCRFLDSAEAMGWRKVKRATMFVKRLNSKV